MIDSTKIRFIYMEAVNFQDFTVGGTLSFSKQLIGQFKDSVALVGILTDKNDPVGKWFIKEISGVSYNYFGLGRFRKSDKKPFIPIRLQTLFYLIYYLPRIRAINNWNVFTQSPQFLFALNMFKWNSLCFCFAGISNPVTNSRYKYLRFFGIVYERMLFKILKKKATVILAAADQKAIKEAIERTGNILGDTTIHSFPTRFDPDIFYPADKTECRKKLNLEDVELLLVTTGRLSWVKGWQLLIDTITELHNKDKNKSMMLVFAGEGEDRAKIEKYGKTLLDNKIIKLAGKLKQQDIALYLNSADVFIMGSFFEGWPTSLVEAMACGCKIVTTNVSAASEIVGENKNGYLLDERDPVLFAGMIEKALTLENVLEYSRNNRDRFSVKYLKDDLEKLWLSKV
jgi:glycosyltransferase involved in cell wall biosynthesis